MDEQLRKLDRARDPSDVIAAARKGCRIGNHCFSEWNSHIDARGIACPDSGPFRSLVRLLVQAYGQQGVWNLKIRTRECFLCAKKERLVRFCPQHYCATQCIEFVFD